MTKVRQDAWSHEDDLLLAETVLRHIREGSTQLDAFEEVGDKLNRTGAACGFRWNAIVRRKYDQAIELAKKQRKQRKRAEQQRKRQWVSTTEPDIVTEPEVTVSPETPAAAVPVSEPPVEADTSALSLKDVITFLRSMDQNGAASKRLQKENDALQQENDGLRTQVAQLEKDLAKLKTQQQTIEEDYQSLIGIMDRARRMVALQDDDSEAGPSFKMDKNGNLEKVAK